MDWYQKWITSKEFGDLLKGDGVMNDIGYKTYLGDGTGKNYVITDDNDKVLEVSYRGYVLSVAGENMIKDEKGNMYISGDKALQIENEELKTKIKKLKRKIDKLESLKSQIKLLEAGLNKVRFEAPTIGIAKDISNSYLAEFLNNEFNRLAEMDKVDNDT